MSDDYGLPCTIGISMGQETDFKLKHWRHSMFKIKISRFCSIVAVRCRTSGLSLGRMHHPLNTHQCVIADHLLTSVPSVPDDFLNRQCCQMGSPFFSWIPSRPLRPSTAVPITVDRAVHCFKSSGDYSLSDLRGLIQSNFLPFPWGGKFSVKKQFCDMLKEFQHKYVSR
jgi:hypothetical protein